ncbi:MAG: hypothetical protein JEZ03_16985, partial [Bacteroidales bacterium]|nr:hypothetical protein [Bacteroidales bacterium]
MYTSRDRVNWNREAKYFYYPHGPLARVELGHDKVQGTDYAYTLQGWLKGVNSQTLVSSRDIGKDGNSGLHNYIPNDAMGLSLHYYSGDYSAIGTLGNDHFLAENNLINPSGAQHSQLYNGNISAMVTTIRDLDPQGNFGQALPRLNQYKYDQLNRLVDMASFEDANLGATNAWNISGQTDVKYKTHYDYDKNGNIVHLDRNGLSPFDNMDYVYNTDANEELNNNRLRYVTDLVSSTVHDNDIDNQVMGNYVYDALGNLIYDQSEGIINIDWNA